MSGNLVAIQQQPPTDTLFSEGSGKVKVRFEHFAYGIITFHCLGAPQCGAKCRGNVVTLGCQSHAAFCSLKANLAALKRVGYDLWLSFAFDKVQQFFTTVRSRKNRSDMGR